MVKWQPVLYKWAYFQRTVLRKRRWKTVVTTCHITFKVLDVSSTDAAVTVQRIDVLAFPPREDCNILVSLESRKGMKLQIKNKILFVIFTTTEEKCKI